MRTRTFLRITAVIFTIISILHLVRALLGISAVFGGWSVPVWVSWIAFVVSLYLASVSWAAR